MKRILTILPVVVCLSANAQNIGIGTNAPNASALLDVTATNKGMLVPRITSVQMNGIASPANGLLVYNTDSSCFAYRNATAWVFLKGNTTASNDWSTKGNAGTDTSKNFIGTTDDNDIVFKRNNILVGRIAKGRMEINSDNTTANGLLVIKNYAAGTNSNISAIYGENAVDDKKGIGVEGKGGNIGVQGSAAGTGILAGYIGVRGISDGSNGALNYGMHGLASGSTFANRAIVGEASGSAGDKYGLYGTATNGGGTNYGIYATASGGTTNYAGYFNGNIEVTDKITVTTAAGSTGLDLATADAYAELRQIRNTTNATDHNLYLGFNGDPASSINFYNGGLTASVTMVNKNVGIGTTDPANKLSIVGNADFSGNVGIGTTTPTNKLSVVGNADFSGNVGIGVTASVVKFDVEGSIMLTNSPTSSRGNIGIGGLPSANTKLKIFADQDFGLLLDGNCPSAGACMAYMKGTSQGDILKVEGTSQRDILRVGGTAVGYNLYVEGAAAKTDGSPFWTIASDARLKEQVKPYMGGLAELLKINPVKYHYTKASGLSNTQENIGILAQELKEVAPYMVFKKKGENTKEEFYNVNLSPLLFMYVNAFKELDAKNKTLEEKIARLEAIVKTLADKK